MAQVRSKKTTRVPKTRATRTPPGASKPRSGRWTMLFAEGNATMRDLLGGKGAGLAEMSRIGLPVPPVNADVWQRGAGAEARALRGHPPGRQASAWGDTGHRAERRRPRSADRGVPPPGAGACRPGVPRGSLAATGDGHPRRLRIVEQPPGHHLPEL